MYYLKYLSYCIAEREIIYNMLIILGTNHNLVKIITILDASNKILWHIFVFNGTRT